MEIVHGKLSTDPQGHYVAVHDFRGLSPIKSETLRFGIVLLTLSNCYIVSPFDLVSEYNSKARPRVDQGLNVSYE